MRSNISSNMSGFTLLRTEEVEEIDSTAYLMSHDTTGARLMFLQNESENKAFSISFKTPPKDSTGVFHILEHSVLNGSRKYPVKEPFVNLLKTSMQTFLNAMTFPDKTMYPVASTNDKDLLNLTDVYLDAVFHPAIYQNKHIFEQEGWHLETETQGDCTTLQFNGVVYNEMKGALSEPEDVLRNVLDAALFPDTLYGFESGGEPACIPDLTYEEFIAEHQRHYQPENSYIILYGDIDIEPMLELINDHLNCAQSGKTDKESHPREIAYQEPVRSFGNTKSMAISPDNTCCAIGYVIGTASDYEKITAVQTLVEALGGSNEAPLKRALLDENIADDITISVADSIAQPYVCVQLKGIEAHTGDKLDSIVSQHVKELLDTGIDKELIEAALSHAEFYLREHDFGYSDGVIDAMSLMAGWLYDEEHPLDALRYIDTFKALREHLADGYFESLLEEIFLNNHHKASAEILADAEAQSTESRNLEKLQNQLSPADIAEIEDNVRSLRAAQEKPDAPQDIAKLPQLSISDIGEAKPWGKYSLQNETPIPCLRHFLETRGITYLQYYYNLKSIPFEKLPAVSVLTALLGKLDTTKHTAAEIDVLAQSNLGYVVFAPKVIGTDENVTDFSAYLSVGASALDSKVAEATTLLDEIIHHTVFKDKSRIKDVLTQLRVQMEQGFIGSGHNVVLSRIAAYQKYTGILSQQLSGIDFYLYLKDLLTNFDAKIDSLCAELEALGATIMTDGNCLISFTGSNESYRTFWLVKKIGPDESHTDQDSVLTVPEPKILHEAFIVPGDVTYTALGYDRRLCPSALPYHGSQMIVANAASLDYLWNEVRVKGGAYGAGLRIQALNNVDFYSYRDPHIDETLARFKQTASWLESFKPDEREFEGYLVSSIAAIDNPVKARNMIVSQNNDFLQKRDSDFRLKTRDQIKESSVAELNAFAQTLTQVNEMNCYCTIGNKDIIQNAKTEFTVIELF